jgi:hypothetical protein
MVIMPVFRLFPVQPSRYSTQVERASIEDERKMRKWWRRLGVLCILEPQCIHILRLILIPLFVENPIDAWESRLAAIILYLAKKTHLAGWCRPAERGGVDVRTHPATTRAAEASLPMTAIPTS